MSECSFQPLLFGGDTGTYSVARAFHESWGVKSIVYGKYAGAYPVAGSRIIEYRYSENNDSDDEILKHVNLVSEECKDKKVIVVGCGDSYVKAITHLQDQFPKNVVCSYCSGELYDRVTDKDQFYKLCDKYGLPHPKTFTHSKEMGHQFHLPWGSPYILKPADSVAWWATGHSELRKVYHCETWSDLLETIDMVYATGYSGKLILQELIVGDDTQEHVLTNYSDSSGNVKLMCMGHVLLGEHSPHGVGNHAVIITEYNEALCRRVRTMLEDLGYVGFSNFDIKYDKRDGRYKFLELNCRQGKSNYYVTNTGNNIADFLVDDLIIDRDTPLVISREQYMWRTCPMLVASQFIPKEWHKKMFALTSAGRNSHPLVYKGDKGIKRGFRMMRNHVGTFIRFNKYCEKPGEVDE